MNPPRLKYEGWFYGLAFLIALGLRLVQLGTAPLTDSEANFALQALHIANGTRPLLGPQPAYILLTSVLFLIFESSNFMARLIPGIMGSVMVFAPMFFRGQLRPRPALILAFLFAIDPGLVALSRLAGGVVLAVAFTLFAWGMWNHRRFVLAGIFAGLALLSGTSIWMGLLGLDSRGSLSGWWKENHSRKTLICRFLTLRTSMTPFLLLRVPRRDTRSARWLWR